jgi:protein-tyrosine sulfotransferase
MSEQPIFIVCNARSGSTLLRCLLDCHPEIACPGETRLAQLISHFIELHTQLAGGSSSAVIGAGAPVTRDLEQQVGGIITDLMSPYMVQRGKTVWCDKSLFTVDFIDQVLQVFPDARYVCLHRHAMDVIASSLDACRWGYRHYGLGPYIQRSTDNFVDGLAEYWTDRTAKIVSFEQMADTATYRVHYEQLVRDPHGTLTDLLEFLNARAEKDVVAGMVGEVFDADHGPGWGDQKLGLTTRVATDSVGRGRAVPAALIHPRRRAMMNSLLQGLGYAVVTEDWNVSGSIDTAADVGLLAQQDNAPVVSRLMRELVQPRLAAQRPDSLPPVDLLITGGADSRQRWTVDASLKTVTLADDGAGDDAGDDASGGRAQVTMRAEVMLALLLRGLPLDGALGAKMIRITGGTDPITASVRAVTRLLASLLTEGS